MPSVVSTCTKCGAGFSWNSDFQEAPLCPSCGYDTVYGGKRSKKGSVRIEGVRGQPKHEGVSMCASASQPPQDNLQVGGVYEGEVVGIKDFGCFVEFSNGQSGMVHISELASHRVREVEDVVKVGDRIKVKVLAIDKDGRVRLSKAQAGDGQHAPQPAVPRCGQTVSSSTPFEVGQVYTGVVTALKDFGCFVELAEGVDGLVHISELASHRVSRTEDVVKVGDRIQVRVLAKDERGRLKLSKRAVDDPSSASGGRCFIATAACGPYSPEVALLRDYRDETLSATRIGRILISAYERLSPPLARSIAWSATLRWMVRRAVVRPAAALVKKQSANKASEAKR